MLQFRSSTTRQVPLKRPQTSSVLSLKKAATATTTAITSPSGVPAMGIRVFATSQCRKTMVPISKQHTQITIQIGDGVVAVGKSPALTVIAITQIVIGGKWYGQGPAGMSLNINHVTMVATTKQKIRVTANQNEKKNEVNLLIVISYH